MSRGLGDVYKRQGEPCVNCGNGSIEDDGNFINEQCDDGNHDEGDGCSSSCQLEPGALCNVPGEACVLCGDGDVAAGESCDDGNPYDRDGCSSSCATEAGWSCPGSGGACYKCGNAVREAGTPEACDDGNTADGDGCSATCTVESGYVCVELPGKLRSTCDTCGNGR